MAEFSCGYKIAMFRGIRKSLGIVSLYFSLALFLCGFGGFKPLYSQNLVRAIVSDSLKARYLVGELQRYVQTVGIEQATSPSSERVVGLSPSPVRHSVASLVNTRILDFSNRDKVLFNPLPEKLGPLWDLQITVDSLILGQSERAALCTYCLYSSGTHCNKGVIKFSFVNGELVVLAIDGLRELLDAEAARIRPTTKQEKSDSALPTDEK